MEIEQYQHPDSIWTWKSNTRGRKASLWIPYLDDISQIRGTKWEIIYNGGELEIDLKEIDTIMLYGASGSVPVLFLDQLGIQKIPMLVHRRNIDSPPPGSYSDAKEGAEKYDNSMKSAQGAS